MSSYVPCAVPGCDDRKSSRHRFPNPEKNKSRFDTWITLIANPKLVNLQPLEVYRNYRVCHQHFTMDDKSSIMYLKRTAVQSLKLPIYAAVLSEMQPNIIGIPSTSTFESDIRKHDILSKHDQLPSKINVASTSVQSFSPSFALESEEVIHTETVEDQYQKNTFVLTQTPPRSASSSDTLLKSVNVSRSSELTPKAKRLYQRATKLQNVGTVYKKRFLTFKKRLQLAEKNKWCFDNSETGLRGEAVKFCIQQLSHKVAKTRGDRYTLEEKLMSLALYKTSGADYRFISKWFNLPTRRTLIRLLENIPINEGIKQNVATKFRKALSKMETKRQSCDAWKCCKLCKWRKKVNMSAPNSKLVDTNNNHTITVVDIRLQLSLDIHNGKIRLRNPNALTENEY
ncbi:hypothetical protein RN001_009079 [Aquatica leii]|uniref:THAP-type domain-containing protein n=1 Tax=Aquatica leii TaxID=1421715 RepID=A0AAN7QFP2_9COLE|nr:hypothetical protein RN001_009079 [Aquatica leii]